MKVCYFGIYNPEYSRNKILISGLKQNDVEVIECRTLKKGFSKYFDLIKKHRLIKNDYDVIVVGYPGFQTVILAKFLTRKPIIFDAFVSLYDSMVSDRGLTQKNSLKAWYFWGIDKLSIKVSDLVLFDTNEHIKFASKEFGIKQEKFRRIFLGADTDVFYPKEMFPHSLFKVSFYGHFIPLQGVEYIIRAAKILENNNDIIFEIIGDGQEKKKILNLVKELDLKNVGFVGNVTLKDLAEKMREADVCLGIFGNTEKTKRVIPNKVFECTALVKPIITSDTSAIRELFTEEELFLVPVASPTAIAEAILKVKSNINDAHLVGKKAYEKLTNVASVNKLGNELKNILAEVKK